MQHHLIGTIVGRLTGEAFMGKNTGGRERPSRSEVARLAYQFYERRGRTAGDEIGDWLRAEAELRRHYGFGSSVRGEAR